MSCKYLGFLSVLIFILSAASTLAAQQQEKARIQIQQQQGPNPWNHLDFYNGSDAFQFAIVTDRTGGKRAGVFPTAIKKLNLLMPEFVMSVGDLIEGYTEDVEELNRQWEEFDGFIDSLHVPFFYVPGNHDITNKTMEELWQQRFGRTYYHFVYNDVLFLCLNSEEAYQGAGKGGIEEEQYAWIEQTLAENQQVKWTLVFMHQPLWTQENPRMWPQVEELLASRKHTVFVGHNHNYVKYERNNGKYFVLATTGGGSRLRGPMFGEFDHVVWVTMTDNGPILANLMLDGIWDENVRTEELASMLSTITTRPATMVEPVLATDLKAGQKPVYNVRIQNRSEGLLHYQARLMQATDSLLSGQVSPNSFIDLQIEAALQDQPLGLDIDYRYEMGEYPDLSLQEDFKLAPIRFLEPKKQEKDVVLDGDLSEWDSLRFGADQVKSAPFHHNGPQDASLRWDLSVQDDQLFVAVQVIDDELFTPTSTGHLEQDAVAILLDPTPLKYSAANRADREWVFKSWFPALVTPHKDEVSELAYTSILGEDFKVHCIRTKEGYQAEFALPLEKLQQLAGGSDNSFRINVFMNDFDKEGQHQSNLSWQPAWDSPENTFGSGVFRLLKASN